MPTRIVFAAPGVKGGVLTQVSVEEPDQVFDAVIAKGGLPFTLTARTSREEASTSTRHSSPTGLPTRLRGHGLANKRRRLARGRQARARG
jgi:hypothetical protein